MAGNARRKFPASPLGLLDAVTGFFGANGDVFFLGWEGATTFLYRVKTMGADCRKWFRSQSRFCTMFHPTGSGWRLGPEGPLSFTRLAAAPTRCAPAQPPPPSNHRYELVPRWKVCLSARNWNAPDVCGSPASRPDAAAAARRGFVHRLMRHAAGSAADCPGTSRPRPQTRRSTHLSGHHTPQHLPHFGAMKMGGPMELERGQI